jgi:hypothetical protein
MKFKTVIIYLILLIFTGCDQYNVDSSKKINTKIEKKYKNSGFTLVYNDNFDFKKLDSRSLKIFHKSLKKKSFVKITNPINKKSLIAEVSSNNVKFSSFYNSVVSNRIAETLELDLKEPFVEIILISKNTTFIVKKAKTFDEEKEVAEKAPIDGIKISNLSIANTENKKQSLNKKFSYSIKIADFYYEKTARLMIDRIKNETTLANFKIIQLSKTNYRLIMGPFNDIKSLRDSFEKIDALYFENLEILKNV